MLVILHKEVFWMATIWTVRSHSMLYTGKQSVASVIVGEILYICFSNGFLYDHNACSVIQWKGYKTQLGIYWHCLNLQELIQLEWPYEILSDGKFESSIMFQHLLQIWMQSSDVGVCLDVLYKVLYKIKILHMCKSALR